MVLRSWSAPCDHHFVMSWAEMSAFERLDKEDHKNDPTLAVDELSDLWPEQTALDHDPTLAVAGLANFFRGREADAPGREDDAIDWFSTANDAANKVPAETSVADELRASVDDELRASVDDELCESD